MAVVCVSNGYPSSLPSFWWLGSTKPSSSNTPVEAEEGTNLGGNGPEPEP